MLSYKYHRSESSSEAIIRIEHYNSDIPQKCNLLDPFFFLLLPDPEVAAPPVY